jgi:hypothetical protein
MTMLVEHPELGTMMTRSDFDTPRDSFLDRLP